MFEYVTHAVIVVEVYSIKED